MTALAQLRALAEALPEGGSISVPKTFLLKATAEQRTVAGGDLTVREVAAHFGRCESTIRSWIAEGSLRGYKLRGRQLRVTCSALEEFEANERAGGAPARRASGTAVDLSAWRQTTAG